MTAEIGLFLQDFPARSEAEWLAAVEKAVKGLPFDKLRRSTPDGISIEPLYARAPGGAVIEGKRGPQPWIICQRIDHPDAKNARDLMLDDLEGGAGGIELVLAGGTGARPHGVVASTDSDWDTLLDGIYPDLVAWRVDGGEATPAACLALAAAAARRSTKLDTARFSALIDPLGRLAATGRLARPVAAAVAEAAALAAALDLAGSGGTVLEADGRVVHAAGGSDVQELAGILASAVSYWRGLVATGLPSAEAVGLIGFTVTADQEQFRTIAKMRALRVLWANALEAAGLDPNPARIHAETAWRSMSRVGPQVNLLRGTIAAMAAGVGGADSVTVLPYSAATGLPDAFARRMARNTQAILLEESNLWRVVDPAAGSGLVEAETTALAERAWTRFQEIEAAGGLEAVLLAGTWQSDVAAVAAERAKAVSRRRQPLTGVSEFPDIGETPVAVLEVPVPPSTGPAADVAVAPMPARRLSEPFERLRSASETVPGGRPRIFLANLGRIADFNARSTWAKNLFEAGGIEALGNDGFAGLDELVAAFRASGARAACLCSSDAIYAEAAVETAGALRAAGAGTLVLAGKPADADTEASYRAAGIGRFVHVGIDVIATLEQLQDAAAPR